MHWTGLPPVQTPARHVSVWVHRLLSVHGVPSALRAGQTPSLGSHVPPVWQASLAHAIGLPPVQTPLWQVSVCVQRLPSPHGVPFALFVALPHTPVDEQVSLLHRLPVVHDPEVRAVPVQTPVVEHVSPDLHGLPVLHAPEVRVVPPPQTPVDEQTSPCRQAVPVLHATPVRMVPP
jgi:hypothetical protein